MAVLYDELWKLLVEKKMSEADLRKASGVSPNSMIKLHWNAPVCCEFWTSLAVLILTSWIMGRTRRLKHDV